MDGCLGCPEEDRHIGQFLTDVFEQIKMVELSQDMG